MFRKLVRYVVVVPLFMVVTPVLATVSTDSAQPVQAQADDPQAVFEQFVAALNAEDLDAALAVVADDVSFTLIDSHVSQAGFGKSAFADAVGQGADVNRVIELTGLATEGNVVTGVSEITDDECEDRYLQPFSVTVDAGLITRAEFTHDETDAQTAACIASLPQLTEPPPGLPTIDMGEQSDSNQTGVAVSDAGGEITIIGIFIEPGAEGVLQPAHVHTGTCDAPGPIVQPLASVLNGVSVTYISTSELPAEEPGQGLVINVHLSDEQMGVYVSCGVIEAAAPAPAATATAAPAATPTAPGGVTAPDTGYGPSADSGLPNSTAAAIAMLALVAGLVAVSSGVRMRRAPSASRGSTQRAR